MAEIKKLQRMLRLHDTPILQAFLQSAAELEKRGTTGVGTSWRAALKGNPQSLFLEDSAKSYAKKESKSIVNYIKDFILFCDITHFLELLLKNPCRGMEVQSSRDQLLSCYANRFTTEKLSAHIHHCCSLHLKIWWNCSRVLSLWAYFLWGSSFYSELKSDLLPSFSACSCCWESFRAEPGTAPSFPPPLHSQPGRGSVHLATSWVRRETPSFEYPIPTSRNFSLWI